MVSNLDRKTNALQYILPCKPWIGPFGHKSCVNKSRWELVLENKYNRVRRVNEVEKLHIYIRFRLLLAVWKLFEKVEKTVRQQILVAGLRACWKWFALPGNALFRHGTQTHIVMKCCEKAFQCHFVYHISQQCRSRWLGTRTSVDHTKPKNTAHSHSHSMCQMSTNKWREIGTLYTPDQARPGNGNGIVSFRFRQKE